MSCLHRLVSLAVFSLFCAVFHLRFRWLYFKVFEDLSEPTFLNAGSVAIKMTDWRARTGHVVDNEQCRITGFSIIVPGRAHILRFFGWKAFPREWYQHYSGYGYWRSNICDWTRICPRTDLGLF